MLTYNQQFNNLCLNVLNLSEPTNMEEMVENLATILRDGNNLWQDLLEGVKNNTVSDKTKSVINIQAVLKGLEEA